MENGARGLVLVVDDEPTNIEVIAEILEEQYEIIFATNGAQALQLAAIARPDVILLDVVMPEMDGYQVCAELMERSDTAGIPVIFITGLGDAAAETRGLELGAMDYIAKPINPTVVKVRVRNQVELKRARDQLTRLAITDGLTGLANRRHFDNVLQTEYRRQARDGGVLSLILFDVDHFKAFNDTYGHVTGDDCLRRIAGVVQGVISRAADTSARYGGEEFVCILPGTGVAGAATVAERLCAGIADLGISHRKSLTEPYVTSSFGVVTVRCAVGASPMHAVALVDEQLYAAKSSGRNRVCTSDLVDMRKFTKA